MKLEGAQVIAADRMTVWNAINNPDILQRCIAGCEEMTKASPTQFDAVVKQKVGPVSATFKGVVTLSDIVEGQSLRLDGIGKGGVAGMAKGGARVTLADVEGGTQLSYDAEASVAGKLAQLGSRLIDGVAQKMINGFFANFKAEIEGSGGAGIAPGAVAPGAVASGSVGAGAGAGDMGSQAAAMAASAGAAGVAGAVAMAQDARGSVEAGIGSAVQGARDSVDAHAGALHDAAAERMLNPAIGGGVGTLAADDLADVDVSAIGDGMITDGMDAARTAAADMGAGVSDSVSSMTGGFDPEADIDMVVGEVDAAVSGAGDTAGAAMAGVASAGAAGVAGAVAMAQDARGSVEAGVGSAVQGVRDSVDAHTGALQDAASDFALNPAIGGGAGAIDMDDPEIGDIDVSSVSGGPSASDATLSGDFDAALAVAADTGAEISDNLSSMADGFDPEADVEMVDTGFDTTIQGAGVTADAAVADVEAAVGRVGESVEVGMADAAAQVDAVADDAAASSRAGMAGGAAVVAGVGAAVTGMAASAKGRFDEAHESARERVIAAGGDIDEAKSWGDTKDHLGRAASETRDTAQDVYDAARARIEGDTERASAEWNDAKTNASEAFDEVKGAGEDAWTTGKGYAAEEAKAPKIGPMGQPWYLWIIGVIVLLVILWALF